MFFCLGIFADLVASINSDDEPNDLASVEDESIESPTLDFDTSKAVEYRVLDDLRRRGRKRLAFDITSEASTEDSKAQTVMLAAFELHRKFGGQVMNARLVDYKGQNDSLLPWQTIHLTVEDFQEMKLVKFGMLW